MHWRSMTLSPIASKHRPTRSCPLFARIVTIRKLLVRPALHWLHNRSLAVRSYEFWGFKQRDAVVNAIRHVSAMCHQRALCSIHRTPVLADTGTLAHDIRRASPRMHHARCVAPFGWRNGARRAGQVASARSHYILLSLASEEEDVEYQTRWALTAFAEPSRASICTQLSTRHTAPHSARHSTQRTTCSTQHLDSTRQRSTTPEPQTRPGRCIEHWLPNGGRAGFHCAAGSASPKVSRCWRSTLAQSGGTCRSRAGGSLRDDAMRPSRTLPTLSCVPSVGRLSCD